MRNDNKVKKYLVGANGPIIRVENLVDFDEMSLMIMMMLTFSSLFNSSTQNAFLQMKA